jgi:hypothetical protein
VTDLLQSNVSSVIVEAGLLKHRAYYDRSLPSEYPGDNIAEEFWEKPEEYLPPLSQQCPINFDDLAIGLIFVSRRRVSLCT